MTNYLDIFSLFTNKINDYSHDSLTIADRNSIYGGYIKSAVPKFVQCDTDLSLRVGATGITELFDGDGATANFTITVTAVTGAEFVVLVSSTTSTYYAVSGNVVTFTTGYIPATGTDTVSISWEFAGEFTEDLTDLEVEIVANMMVLEWLKPSVNHMDLLEYRLGSKDFQQWSPAGHLKELRGLKKDIELEIDLLIVKYSYNNDLSDLG